MALKPEKEGELRGMVRDVLREVMASRAAPEAGVEQVRIANDSDLAAFIQRFTDPATLDAVRTGKLRFTLAAAPPQGTVLAGVITEQRLGKLSCAGTLVLDATAVLTPLARDRARRLGLKIERKL